MELLEKTRPENLKRKKVRGGGQSVMVRRQWSKGGKGEKEKNAGTRRKGEEPLAGRLLGNLQCDSVMF